MPRKARFDRKRPMSARHESMNSASISAFQLGARKLFRLMPAGRSLLALEPVLRFFPHGAFTGVLRAGPRHPLDGGPVLVAIGGSFRVLVGPRSFLLVGVLFVHTRERNHRGARDVQPTPQAPRAMRNPASAGRRPRR